MQPLVPLVILAFAQQAPLPDFGHDLGVAVREAQPLAGPTRAALARVAEHTGCAPEELAEIRLFRARLRPASGPEHAEELVLVPLHGTASGARLVFSAVNGQAREIGLWNALDFDADPTLRWSLFLQQLRNAGMRETGPIPAAIALAMPPASEAEGQLAELAERTDDEARLARALQRQRLVMRRNGMWLGMSRRAPEPPAPAWLEELGREMEELARLAPELAPVLGAGGPARYAGFARELAGGYAELAARLTADPRTEQKELHERLLAACAACHRAASPEPEAEEWRTRAAEQRRELELAATRLQLGYDIAPAHGDDGRVSRELADKLRAGLLLLEAARE